MQGIQKLDPIPLHHKSDDIAPLFASVTVKKLFGGMNVKRGRLFRMKRTKAYIILTRPFQGDGFTDQVDDIGCRENLQLIVIAVTEISRSLPIHEQPAVLKKPEKSPKTAPKRIPLRCACQTIFTKTVAKSGSIKL
jgi:hypothetical protein